MISKLLLFICVIPFCLVLWAIISGLVLYHVPGKGCRNSQLVITYVKNKYRANVVLHMLSKYYVNSKSTTEKATYLLIYLYHLTRMCTGFMW